jgi:hypothetical protein
MCVKAGLTLREECRLTVFDYRVLKKTFGIGERSKRKMLKFAS